MAADYDVTVWKIQTRYRTNDKGRKVPARYIVRWQINRTRFEKTYKIRAQADSFRSELLAAAKNGEKFDAAKGLPLSMLRASVRMTWFDFARKYVDLKWDDSAPKSRKSTADNLIAITRAVVANRPGEPAPSEVGRALRHAYNKIARGGVIDDDIEAATQWIADASPTVAELAEPATFRALIGALDRRRDGSRAAPDTVRLRRTTLRSSLDYAVELKVLDANPLVEVKIKRTKVTLREVDRQSVVNPMQARTLLRAVNEINGRLTAFFSVMYYAALRPEEAVNLRRRDLVLPDSGWGEIHLRKAAPEVGSEWTDSGAAGEERELKHRGVGVGRTVPCSPDLVAALQEHLARHGTAKDGRLFPAMRSDRPLSSSLYGRVWGLARTATFTTEVLTTPLAKRPYDLRHAAVSTWLNATGDPTRVAEWAGHTVSVLLRVYAKCIDGGEQDARKKVQDLLLGA